MKAKRQLLMLRSVLRPKVIWIKTRVNLLETVTGPVLPYGSSSIVDHKVDNNKVKAFQNIV